MDFCRNDIQKLLLIQSVHEEKVKVFHIKDNDSPLGKIEPNPSNTTNMIFKFLIAIYQRNILATIVKYILLKPLLDKFNSSNLIPEKRGIFFRINQRLTEILFECVLLSFNGSNYDNYLICNSLITILSQLREKIKVFKKGSSISTVMITIKKNIGRYQNTKSNSTNQRKPGKWLMKLYLKDVRNLVAANMSLEKIGKLFNLKVVKLAFPYEQAISVQRLKELTSLHVYNEKFWKNTFAKNCPLEDRIEAQAIYNEKKFDNVYDFSVYYLIQDCLLLHSIVITLFTTYLTDNLNIFTRRNYSQSSLAFQQFFIVEPSRQIKKLLAPKKINNSFYNYMIKQAVTGGLCTSFVHGKIDHEVPINEIFNYITPPNLCPKNWPNFNNLTEWKFDQKPSGISTIDIRSLYPSASVKKIPVNRPLFYTRFTNQDHTRLYSEESFYRVLNIKQYCQNVRENNNSNTDIMRLTSERPTSYNEFYCLAAYLKSLPNNIEIIRFQAASTAFGQLFFVNYPVDGFLTYREKETIYIKIIQYHSVYYHGHRIECSKNNTDAEQILYQKTQTISQNIKKLCDHFAHHFNLESNCTNIEYVEIFDCDFPNHIIPKDYDVDPFLPFYKTFYSYPDFVQQIHSKKLTGLIVVQNLKISHENQNPIFGFIAQKIEYGLNKLSPYTQEQLSKLDSSKRIVSVHEAKGYLVISTEYFNWLRKTFGFQECPIILHALVFQLDDYLRESIESKLKIRQALKTLIKKETNTVLKQNYEVKAELIKLMLNSCYGYTLCNLTSTKFKQFENRLKIPNNFKNVISCFRFSKGVYFVQTKKPSKEHFSTMLGHVGCYILFYSKIIFHKRLFYCLKYFNPKLVQLLYMDTDSAHFLVKHKKFIDNVDKSLQDEFKCQFNKHFETGDKISGIWVQEGFYEFGEYLGEKCYRLYNTSDSTYLTHMKGLNTHFQKEYHEKNIDPKALPYLSYNNFYKSPDFVILKTHMSKNLFTNYVPNKRYFVSASGSLPLKFS